MYLVFMKYVFCRYTLCIFLLNISKEMSEV